MIETDIHILNKQKYHEKINCIINGFYLILWRGNAWQEY